MKRGAGTVLYAIALAVLLGCASTDSANTDGTGADSTTEPTTTLSLGNPGTLVPPTTQPPPDANANNLLPVETLVGFLDACAADSGLVGPCHCAAERLDSSFTPEDIQIFEDRITGQLEYPPQVAADLVFCRQAPAPAAWNDEQRERYVAECTKGSDLLQELCTCSLARAQDIIPADRLDEYLASVLVRPDFTDLINLCV